MIPQINDLVQYGNDIGKVIAKSGSYFSFVDFRKYTEWIDNDLLIVLDERKVKEWEQ